MAPTALSQFLLGVAGVAYGTALFIEPGVVRAVATRVFDVEPRDVTTGAAKIRRVVGVALVAAGMWLITSAWAA